MREGGLEAQGRSFAVILGSSNLLLKRRRKAYARKMKVVPRAHVIGTILYAVPFLGIFACSLFYMWAGNTEMMAAGVALAAAILFLCGVRWCRYVMAAFSVITFLVISAIPFLRGTEGKYFWVIWGPLWLVAGLAAGLLLKPARKDAGKRTDP
jgi:hypothetical protein